MEIKIYLGQVAIETNHADEKKHRSLNFWVVLGRSQVNTQRKIWKIFTEFVEIRSDSIKIENFIA